MCATTSHLYDHGSARRAGGPQRCSLARDVRQEQAEVRARGGKLALYCECSFSVSTVCQAIYSCSCIPVASAAVLAFKWLLLTRCTMKCTRGACVVFDISLKIKMLLI